MDLVTVVTGGPDGFVAVGEADGSTVVWLSADGHAWDKVDVLESQPPTSYRLNSAAATEAGYVLVGGDSTCRGASCSAVIWTSPDGRSWSRVPDDDRFAAAAATQVIAFESQFVVGGQHEGGPAVWVSASEATLAEPGQ
jgi:hypothetical protein